MRDWDTIQYNLNRFRFEFRIRKLTILLFRSFNNRIHPKKTGRREYGH